MSNIEECKDLDWYILVQKSLCSTVIYAFLVFHWLIMCNCTTINKQIYI